MKQGDYVSKINKQQSDSLFLFSLNRFQSFFVSRMSVETIFMEKLQKPSREKL
jgi:hypothetical protein